MSWWHYEEYKLKIVIPKWLGINKREFLIYTLIDQIKTLVQNYWLKYNQRIKTYGVCGFDVL
jgi:hypothetical protein